MVAEPHPFPPSLTITRPTFTLKDLPGLSYVKQLLTEWVLLPLKFPQLFVGSRRQPQCIYLYGPSGSGKSQLVAACAGECGIPLYSICANDLIREGSGARLVKAIFSHVRANSPAILLITSIEDFCSNEESDFLRPILTELLINVTPFNDQSSNLSVILTSSTPWASNNFMRAIRRRAEREAYVPLPDAVRRRAMLQRTVQFDSEREYLLAADLSEGMSFWEIQDIVRRAVLHTASSDSPASLLSAILSAFQSTVPNTSLRSIELFQAYVTERSD